MVPYVDAVVDMTVMPVLLFVLQVCLLKECDGARLTAMLVWGIDEVWCMRFARGGVGGEGGEWIRGLGLAFTNPV